MRDPEIRYCYHDSPLGLLLLGGTSQYLERISFSIVGLPASAASGWIEDESCFKRARRELDDYFSRKLKIFSVPYRAKGTQFQMAVWKALEEVSFGEVRSYGEIAKMVGQPGGAQAVGMANNANPLPIVIPCHRIIGADGSLVGFGGGMKAKIWLLEHEGINPSQVYSPNQLSLGF